MLLADCTEAGALRGYARADAEALATMLSHDDTADAAALLGRGYLAFTCDQGPEMERYQGIVNIEGLSLADMTGHYFRTSEQLRTHVRLACEQTASGWRASAFIMEKVAAEGGIDPQLDAETQEEAWNTALALAGTLTDADCWTMRCPPPACCTGCSTPRVWRSAGRGRSPMAAAARAPGWRRCWRISGTGDLDHMAQDDGAITMTCEFCNLDFRFDRTEIQGNGTAS